MVRGDEVERGESEGRQQESEGKHDINSLEKGRPERGRGTGKEGETEGRSRGKRGEK